MPIRISNIDIDATWSSVVMCKKTIGFSICILLIGLASLPAPAFGQYHSPIQSKVRIPAPSTHTVFSTAKVTGAAPTFGDSGTEVTITGTDLLFVKSVQFGGTPAYFTLLPNGNISTRAPAGVSGSTVPITITTVFNDQLSATGFSFSYPIANMWMEGPRVWDGADRDSAWYNGRGHGFELNPHGPLVFGTAQPVFHITISFSNTGDNDIVPPAPLPHDIGNYGEYWAKIRMCSLTDHPTFPDEGGPCTNWDGNSGVWIDVGSDQRVRLDRPSGAYQTTTGDIALPAGSAFDQTNLVRTFQIEMGLALHDSRTAEGDLWRTDIRTTDPFDVAISPKALVELNVQPYTIVYHPPGNQSTTSFSTSATYGTNFKLGNATDISNKYSNINSQPVKGSIGIGYKGDGGSAAVTLNASQTWDKTTVDGFGTTVDSQDISNANIAIKTTWSTAPSPLATPGSGITCASGTDCAPAHYKSVPNVYNLEPFWNDQFVLQVHPQFAVWTAGTGGDYFVQMGAVPALATVYVSELAACAHGQLILGQDPCFLQYSTAEITAINNTKLISQGKNSGVTLTATEAANLLALDPFYVAGQGAALDPKRAVFIQSTTYGTKIGESNTPPNPFTKTFNNTNLISSAQTNTLTHTSSVIDVIGSDTTAGFKVDSGILNTAIDVTDKENSSTQTDIKTTYSDATTTSTQMVTESSVTLNDIDNTTVGTGGLACKICHDPLPLRPSVNIYLDRIFGSYMFQDPAAPVVASRRTSPVEIANIALSAMMNREQSRRRYSDVKDDSPAKMAINSLAVLRIMPGINGSKFEPDAPLTRAQLAVIMTNAIHLSLDDNLVGRRQFKDAGPTEPYHLAAQAASAIGIVRTRSVQEFGPEEQVSRQELAYTLWTVFKSSLTQTDAYKSSKTPIFEDEGKISEWAKMAAKGLVHAGVMNNESKTLFKPEDKVTRQSAAQLIFSVLKAQHNINLE